MRSSTFRAWACCACLLTLSSATLFAGVGDPTLRTDHPHYAGEGAFQTVEQCVEFATRGADSPQEKAIAQFLWLLAHQYHLASPQEWLVPGRIPDTTKDNQYDLIVYDANRSRFSYGYGLCGTVHAYNEPYWNALGLRARRRAFPGHTNSEIEYDGGWHAFDTDMAGLVFREDGIVAGYEDIARDPSLAAPRGLDSIPCYPFAWPGDYQVMRQGWQKIAEGGHWYKMYNSGYAAHPGIVRLRAGETFTRYFDRDHFGGPEKRRFWHHQAGGPFRNWTFVNAGTPVHDGPQSNALGNASYANGEFVYRPDITSDSFREGTLAASANLVARPESPRLTTADDSPASVTFRHYSPYVICGDPLDDANPMTGPATGGLVVAGLAAGNVELELSVDQGQTWQPAGTARGPFVLDLTDAVKGHYGWLLRFQIPAGSGLDELTFTTVTQVAQAIYPRLSPGGSTVHYRAASRDVVPVLPNFALAESDLQTVEEQPLRSPNVAYLGLGPNSRTAYQTTNNRPGSVAFRIDSPAEPLREVSAAVQYQVRVPSPADCDYHLELSTDGGTTWREFARADVPTDNEFSSGWVYGWATVAEDDVRTALVRAHFYAGGHRTGIAQVQLYGVCATPPPQQPLRITYGWREGDDPRTYSEDIPAGTTDAQFVVPTGAMLTDDFVRFEVPAQ